MCQGFPWACAPRGTQNGFLHPSLALILFCSSPEHQKPQPHKMSAAEEAVERPRKRAKRPAAPEEAFSVKDYVQDIVELDLEDLQIDVDLTKGQVRRLDSAHRDELVSTMTANPPSTLLQVTTWAAQGMGPTGDRMGPTDDTALLFFLKFQCFM